ncbi:MAG: hypothetical protein KBC83_00855 [Candidatus Moranbacteria bacterium]|jgi:hypothetical protein|nr:hypothetical protein [Candidatus Moranbacteria bacterium]MBP9801207.1 hypothetical protein [Candidatus Moranbacteria bacterium]
MQWILMPYREAAIETFLALWLLRKFGTRFRDARVTYCLYGFPENITSPKDTLMLERGCLSAWCQFERLYLQIPPEINAILSRHIEEILADKNLDWQIIQYWREHTEGCIFHLLKILFTFFQERLDAIIEEIEEGSSV